MSIQNPIKQSDPPPVAALIQLITGSWVSQAIYVAAKLGLADLMKDGPKGCDELADAARAEASSLRRLLRALSSVGVFAETDDGQFHLTSIAELLKSDAPYSMRAFATMVNEDWHWSVCGQLLYSLRTGKPAFDYVHGMGLYQYFLRNPEDARVFDAAMADFSASEVELILAAYDFSKHKKVADVAGGNGNLIIPLLKTDSETSAILFDLPHVIERAKGQIEAEGLAERCELVGGDFFQEAPKGGDLYVLKHIIHNYGDEEALSILRNCHRAMSVDARLLIIEMVIQPGNNPSFGKLLDLEMLLIGGAERTEAEYRALLAEAGCEMTRVIPTGSAVSIIESVLKK
jgi:O-methyltransferase domain/Dimerisation domain